MLSTQSRRELLIPYDPELVRKMNTHGVQNNTIIEKHAEGVGNEITQVLMLIYLEMH